MGVRILFQIWPNLVKSDQICYNLAQICKNCLKFDKFCQRLQIFSKMGGGLQLNGGGGGTLVEFN